MRWSCEGSGWLVESIEAWRVSQSGLMKGESHSRNQHNPISHPHQGNPNDQELQPSRKEDRYHLDCIPIRLYFKLLQLRCHCIRHLQKLLESYMSALQNPPSRGGRTVSITFPRSIRSHRPSLRRDEAHDFLIPKLLGSFCNQLNDCPNTMGVCFILVLCVTGCRHEIG
jgi:hypothetical protein